MLEGRGWKNLSRLDNDFCDWLAKLADLSLIAPFGYCGQGHMLTAAFGGQPVATLRAPSHAGSRWSTLNENNSGNIKQPRPDQLYGTDHGVDAWDDAQVYCTVTDQDDFPGILLSCFYLEAF